MRVARTSTATRDRELLTRVASGDRSALDELYLGYHPRLRRFLSLCLQRDSIDEVINDTFMVVWRKSKDFRNASQVSTWIIGIAYRTAIKEQRRQKRYATWLSLDECTESCVDSTAQTETRDWLREGLGSLSRDQQLALLLSYGAGYAVDEIATLTLVPVGTVKTRLFHARNKLRRVLPVIGGDGSSVLSRSAAELREVHKRNAARTCARCLPNTTQRPLPKSPTRA
jgi:RNA polymerase sigma-70 factor, ECF subfamily